MPALQKFFAIGKDAPRAIVVLPGAGHFFHGRLGQIKQVVLHEFSGQHI